MPRDTIEQWLCVRRKSIVIAMVVCVLVCAATIQIYGVRLIKVPTLPLPGDRNSLPTTIYRTELAGQYSKQYESPAKEVSRYDVDDEPFYKELVGVKPLKPFCGMYSSSYKKLIWPKVPSNFSDWTYKKYRKCPKLRISNKLTNITRIKYYLNCFNNEPNLVPFLANSSHDVQVIKLNNTCLALFVNRCCTDSRGVPNILHYVWYFKKEMQFSMFLSMLSVIRFVKPCLILFHGHFLPYGKYWDYIIRIYPNIFHNKIPRPLTAFGKKIQYHEHSGDFMRMEAMIQLGGIYFDTDIIALRDLEPLRQFRMTLCNQSDGYLLNSFIMATRNATFMSLWMDGYRKDYRNDSYVYNSMFYNNEVALKRPELIHVEQGTLCSPPELLQRTIRSRLTYDWSGLYGYHLHSRTIYFNWDVNMIKRFNTTMGAMVRQVVYGNKELCY